MKKSSALILGVFAGLLFSIESLAALSPGTKLVGSIDRELSSKHSQVGETFLIKDAHTTNYDINGATIYGHVAHIRKAGQGTTAQIELDVDKVNTRTGSIYKITGQVVNVQVNTKSNAGKEALSAAGGALVGGLIGKGWGAVIGATGGYLYSKNSKENVTIPSGSLVEVHVSGSNKVALNGASL